MMNTLLAPVCVFPPNSSLKESILDWSTNDAPGNMTAHAPRNKSTVNSSKGIELIPDFGPVLNQPTCVHFCHHQLRSSHPNSMKPLFVQFSSRTEVEFSNPKEEVLTSHCTAASSDIGGLLYKGSTVVQVISL